MDINDSLNAIHGLNQLASILKSYYNELINAGFTHDQAQELVIEFQNVSLKGSFKREDV